MKKQTPVKLLLLALLAFSITFTFAQIPNAGFETWSGSGSDYNAASWGDLNSSTGILGIYTVQRATGANVHSGTYAMELYSQYISFASETAPGIAATTSINTSTQDVEGGFPLNYRPYKFKGWFKYTPNSPDTFSASLSLYSGVTTGTPIGTATFSTGATVGTYTEFSVLVNYTSSAIPDSAQIILLSSSSSAPQKNSKAWVDDLSLVNCTGMAVTATPTNISCNAPGSGKVVAVAAGASAPYTYLWSNTATTDSITAVAANTYTVVATDTDGCTASASATVGLTNVPFTVNTTITPSCADSNGKVVALASGGSDPYTYHWSTGANGNTISKLVANTYTLTATDNNGCTTGATAIVSAANVPFTLTLTPATASCASATGSVTTTVSSPNTPYVYRWSNHDTLDANLTNVIAGTYTLTVTDHGNCTATASTIVSSVNTSFTVTTGSTNTSCVSNTGTATASASGGNAPYTYLWTGNDTAHQLTALGSGNYDVTVTDAHGCTTTSSATVNSATGPSATDTIKNVACFGQATGAVTVVVTGGTNPVHYKWSNADTTKSLTAIGAGSYTLTITDASNCSFQVSANVQQPQAALSINGVVTNVTCNGNANGTVTITPSGGTIPYSFTWNNNNIPQPGQTTPGQYEVTITDANACSISATYNVTQPNALAATTNIQNVGCFGQSNGSITVHTTGGTKPYSFTWNNLSTDSSITNQGGGIYTLTILDANQCPLLLTDTITSPLAALTAATTSVTNVACFGQNTGGATVLATGGTTPYAYQWTPGGNTTATLSQAAAGSYSITVSDINNCTTGASAVITQPALALTANIAVVNASSQTASDGSASVAASGGTPPYTYSWITGSTDTSVNHLQADTYAITVTDSAGCSIVSNAIVSYATAIGNVSATHIKLYPNPANAQVIIATNAASGTYIFSLYSLDGQLVKEVALTDSKTTVDLQPYSAGLYTYRLKDTGNGLLQFGKLEIQR